MSNINRRTFTGLAASAFGLAALMALVLLVIFDCPTGEVGCIVLPIH